MAGDELTISQVAETFSIVTGREVEYFQVPWDQFEEQMGEEFTVMYRWFSEVGYEANIGVLREIYPELAVLEHYLHSHGWENAGLIAEI